ncbi:hypothetical protein LCGC14_0615320 [marine sediment metagenome]|uniref:Uncharacterized protein n=1 Tax=marine sediment metagenome TaxID=412755 RepID=A0A0F9RQN7_9ZZZZ|nr:hypothetical protein [bacterium]
MTRLKEIIKEICVNAGAEGYIEEAINRSYPEIESILAKQRKQLLKEVKEKVIGKQEKLPEEDTRMCSCVYHNQGKLGGTCLRCINLKVWGSVKGENRLRKEQLKKLKELEEVK